MERAAGVNVRLAVHAMGTRFELVLHGQDEFFLRAAGEEIISDIEEQHARLSVFERGSLLSRVNLLAAERAVEVDEDLFSLLRLCRSVWAESEGAFDPAVGGLMHKWGFRDGSAREDGTRGGMACVVLDERARSVRFTESGPQLDLGGVAKGWVLDRARERLAELGVGCALMHGGTSTVVGVGSPPGEAAWRVRVGYAALVSGGLVEVRLKDAAMSVSMPGGRSHEVEGETIGHIMDPRSGEPARGRVGAVVVCASAAEADAWSTAMVVLGRRPRTMPPDIESATLEHDAGAWCVESRDSRIVVV